jgi:hypothetical protein
LQRARGTTPIGAGPPILEQVMRAAPGAVTREQIERTVWGNAPPESDYRLA